MTERQASWFCRYSFAADKSEMSDVLQRLKKWTAFQHLSTSRDIVLHSCFLISHSKLCTHGGSANVRSWRNSLSANKYYLDEHCVNV